MILVRLNDKYVAPLKEYAERIVKKDSNKNVHCKYVGCNHLGMLDCKDCKFYGKYHKLEDVEVKFKFIEEEN